MSTVPEKLTLRVKGPVNSRKEVYIARPSDYEVFEHLKKGEYCNVVSSRQMGKTSLLFLTKVRLDEIGVKTCSIDVGGYLGTVSPENADAWYQDLLQEIADQLGLSVDVATWWRSNSSATPNRRLIQFFRDEVAVRAGTPVVVFLDEIESTLKLSYTDDFFLAIRAMYNDRLREPAFERITFCLLGVATPNELIKTQRTTPYNIGSTVELRDFDPERDDLGELYSAVDDEPDTGKKLVNAVLIWTGGHPYLTMKHCLEVARSGMRSFQEVDQSFERSYTIFEPPKADEHFETVLRFVRERVDDSDRLNALTLYRQIYRGRQVLDRTTPAHIALKLSGLAKRDDRGSLVVRNPIYRRAFTDRWATTMMRRAARHVRAARLLTAASITLLLSMVGVWYEGIYPYQLASSLNAAVAAGRYDVDTYLNLASIPFQKARADRIWAGVFDRRAADAESQEHRDEALLWRLKARTVLATDRRSRDAAALIGEDCSRLFRTIHLPVSDEVLLTADGRAAAAVNRHGTIRLRRTESGLPIGKTLELDGIVYATALSGDGTVLAAALDKGVRLWRTESGLPIGKTLEPGGRIDATALSGDGSVLAAAVDKVVHLWRTESGDPLGKPIDCGSDVTALALSGDGRVVATRNSGSTVRVWRTDSGQLIGKPLVDSDLLNRVALSGDGRVVVTARDRHRTVRLWRTETGQPIGEPLDFGDEITSLAVSGDGRVAVAGGLHGTVRLWLVGADHAVGKPLNLGEMVSRVAVSDDGRVAAIGSRIVRTWKTAVQPIGRPLDYGKPVFFVAMSDDGRNVAMGNLEGAVQLWRKENGKPYAKRLDLGDAVLAVGMSSDGSVVAVAERSDTMQLWRTKGGESIGKPLVLKRAADSLALSGDGRVVAAHSLFGETVKLFRPESGEPIGKPYLPWLNVVLSYPNSLALSGDWSVLASGTGTGEVILRSTQSGEPIGTPLKFGDPVTSITFSPDGRALLIATRSWVHMVRFDSTGLTHVASRLYPGYWPFVGGWKFLDESGSRVQMVDGFSDNQPRFVTVRFDQPDAEPVQGNPLELLHEWEQRLALTIDQNGQIVPILAPDMSPRPGS